MVPKNLAIENLFLPLLIMYGTKRMIRLMILLTKYDPEHPMGRKCPVWWVIFMAEKENRRFLL